MDATALATSALSLALLMAVISMGQQGEAFPVDLPANNRSLTLGDCSWVQDGARGHLATVVSRCAVPNAWLSTLVTLRTTQVTVAGVAPACTISCVRAVDHLAETALLNVTLSEGGPGHTYVALEVRAPPGYGYFFTVDAFLNCTATSAPAVRQTFIPAPSGDGAPAPSCWPCNDGGWF